jgi:hypothetical protein
METYYFRKITPKMWHTITMQMLKHVPRQNLWWNYFVEIRFVRITKQNVTLSRNFSRFFGGTETIDTDMKRHPILNSSGPACTEANNYCNFENELWGHRSHDLGDLVFLHLYSIVYSFVFYCDASFFVDLTSHSLPPQS